MIDERTPVLVGCGQLVQKEKDVTKARSPIDFMADAARLAADDTGLGARLWDVVDNVTVVRFITDSPDSGRLPFGKYTNAPRTLSTILGAHPARGCYGPTGGNTPQFLVNITAQSIADGETEVALVAGSECFATMMRAVNQGIMLPWGDDPEGAPRIDLGTEKPSVTDVEKKHKLQYPVNAYPLIENAIRAHKGRTAAQHQLELGRLMATFTDVAAAHPQAWFPVRRTAEEIATPGDDNRYVGFPYTKYMNAIMQVDQAAAIVMMSVKKARELGVSEDKWVFLHGCADANDIWYMSERQDFHSSPAIRVMGRQAFAQASWSVGDIDYIDLYSCFPSAVQIGRQELGIAEDDPRLLTVTGGLPYFGGAGNDYVMHSIVTMMEKLRAKPGTKGLVTSNGWYITKHGIGLYSTEPFKGKWQRADPAIYQAELDAGPRVTVVEKPDGPATIETYTVVHGRKGPDFAIVFGRLEDGSRFIAHTPNDELTLHDMVANEQLGRKGRVSSSQSGLNIFTPE